MGSSSVLVIGDDWAAQLDRYQSMEYAHPLNPNIIHINRLPEALTRYPNATTGFFRLPDGRELDDWDLIKDELKRHGRMSMTIVHKPLNGATPFLEWAKHQYGVHELRQEAEPDLFGQHRWGWIRINEAGEVTELAERAIPGNFFFFFLGTCADFLLKPGATGWNIERTGQMTEVTGGYAGSARLSNIDFAGMRQKLAEEARERWEAVHRAAAGKTWKTFTEIRKKYPPQTEKRNAGVENAARNEWFHQPTLRKIDKARCVDYFSPAVLDLMLMPCVDYVRHCSENAGVLRPYDVIKFGEHLVNPNETDLLSELGDDVLLTSAVVKC